MSAAVVEDVVDGMDAPSEGDSDRDGILSYAREWHALGIGAGAGFAAVATGDAQLAGAVVAAALAGSRANDRLTRTVVVNLKSEPWYAILGLAIGGALGVLEVLPF